jgi:hypothetical protein
MPGLARKVVIYAAVDGLILQPHSSRKEQRPSPPYQIRYGDAAISAISRDISADIGKANASFEAFGIVGKSGHSGDQQRSATGTRIASRLTWG